MTLKELFDSLDPNKPMEEYLRRVIPCLEDFAYY
jgi:hypothetical protein